MEKKQTLSIETVGFATIPVETYNQMLIESATIKTLLTKAIAIKDGYLGQPQIVVELELLRDIIEEKLAASKFADSYRLRTDDYIGRCDNGWCFEKIEVAEEVQDVEDNK